MAVAPDILLTSTPDSRPKAALSRSAQNSSNSSNDKGSSFADMYAKEQRPAASERADKPVKAKTEKTRDASDKGTASKNSTAPAAADQPKVAEDGKALPADGASKADETSATADAKPDATLDPLLMLGMTGQLPEPEAPPLVVSTGTSQLSDASGDDDLQKLNEIPGVNLALGLGDDQARPVQPAPLNAQLATKAGGKADAGGKDDLSAALAALNPDSAAKGGETKLAEGALKDGVDLTQQLADVQTDAKPEMPRNETFAARLDSITQALNTPQAMTSRPVNPLVPGQPVSVQQNGWTDQVVDRVMWMSSQNLKSAEIQMDPADLGRLEVRIHMTADQTQVNFVSANAGVREALDSQQHRLREMFNQQGMGQLDVNVSDQSARGWQQQQQGDDRGGSRRVAGSDSGDDEPMISGVSEIRPQTAGQGRGLVDYYA